MCCVPCNLFTAGFGIAVIYSVCSTREWPRVATLCILTDSENDTHIATPCVGSGSEMLPFVGNVN